MKNLFSTLIILIFLIQIAAAEDCTGYTDSFDIRVLDAKIRPVEGASIQVKFDRGTSFGDQYFTTSPEQTDENGMVHITIHNQGTETREIDCTIWITVIAGGAQGEKITEANAHGPIVDVMLDAYPVEITVNDQEKHHIENATVTLAGISKLTGSDGTVEFYMAPGDASYLVSYYRGKESGVIAVSADTEYEVILQRHSISIDAMDEQGEAVNATITIFEETMPMENGHYETGEVYGDSVVANVSYMSITKDITLYPAVENEITVVFDLAPPVIDSIETSSTGARPRLTTRIIDSGPYASGVDPTSISVTYHILPETGIAQWSTATTFVSGADTYITDFPEIEPGKIIEFKIEVRDYEGNKKIKTGKFVTEKEPENGEIPTEPEEESQEIPLFYIVIGVILIIVVVYIVKRLTNKGENEV